MKSLDAMKESVNKNAENFSDNFSVKANEIGKKTGNSMKEGGEDWLKYVKEHPFQTMMYGAVIFFAFKGLIK